ncbi:MAG: polynucleotide kinase-phosphatase [Fimbriimonadaceae bacterium]
MRIAVPEFSMVVVIGTSGSGKSTFCRNFLPSEVLSSDTFRGYVCDDEDSLDVSQHAFDALHFMLGKRLELGRLTVVDATNVQKESRAPLLAIANKWHALRVAIILDTPEALCRERNEVRPNRQFGPHVIRNQRADLRRTFGQLKAERYHKVYYVKPEDANDIEIVREPIWSRKPDEHGPFDIIGDVHGCMTELNELLVKLGWKLDPLTHPDGRKLIFVGDLVDRGPDSVGVLKLVMKAVGEGSALCVPGNHDIKLMRALAGKKVTLNHGLAETLEQLAAESEEFRAAVQSFLEKLVSHAVLDNNKLCVAHAGLPQEMQGRGSGAVREFALYGETTGEIDEFGLPVRYEWARNYRGKALVVFGHTPVPRPEWLNNTIDIDTGCCFGGSLTGLRYPERELVSVSAHETYCEPIRPIGHNEDSVSSQQAADDVLDLQDVVGRMSVETRLANRITIREENAVAALEVMSRFAADPRWLVYLPPTMSPCGTSERDGYLEYPSEALDYYRSAGVSKVVCEEKHMGSRAVAVVCKSPEVALRRFGVDSGDLGIITSRTGRRFFDDLSIERTLLERLVKATQSSGVFNELESDWILLDLELMPWSAKAVGLLREQYAPVGAAAEASARIWTEVTTLLAARGVEGAEAFQEKAHNRAASASRFRDAYRRYCWTVNSIEDYKLAPFHLLSSEGNVHIDKSNEWHMATLARICEQDPAILVKTPFQVVNLESEEECEAVCKWWEDLVSRGGEGMVVKPFDFIVTDGHRTLQPAVKCRGPEYLRIIYGPEYLEPANLANLRKRGLNRKRSLASREFALGIEALERFARNEPLRRVHECVFGVLALESEPVDPRL